MEKVKYNAFENVHINQKTLAKFFILINVNAEILGFHFAIKTNDKRRKVT